MGWPCLALVALGCLLTLATSAAGEEPKGFLTWPWGTTKETMLKGKGSWCQFPAREAEAETTITCRQYFVGDIPVGITLNFLPDDTLAGYLNYRLAGYSMGFASESYFEIRSTAVERFGPPTSTQTLQYRMRNGVLVPGEELEWRWPNGTTATLMHQETPDLPTPGVAVLEVSTKTRAELLRKEEERKKQERRKAFP
jgi:hypothetical protein